jgi:ribulose 1,5-bisphosphate synthetase/thiazole synthase
MSHCTQATITEAAFEHLRGIAELVVVGGTQATITAAEGLEGAKVFTREDLAQHGGGVWLTVFSG